MNGCDIMQESLPMDEFYVPSLDDLHQVKILDKVESIYYYQRKKFIKEFPILANYPQDMIPIYLIYFSIYLNVQNNGVESSNEFVDSLKNDIVLAKTVGKNMNYLAQYFEDRDVNNDNFYEKYQKYIDVNKESLINRDPKVVKFMNTVYTDKVKESIYAYLVGEKVPAFEKLGLDLNLDESIEMCEFIFYTYLHKYYLSTTANNPFFKHKFIKSFRNTRHEAINDLTKIYLDAFQEYLLSYDEFVKYIHVRQLAIGQLIDFSQKMYDEYYGDESRVRE